MSPIRSESEIGEFLLSLGAAIRNHLVRSSKSFDARAVVRQGEDDTIFGIDADAGQILDRELRNWPSVLKPVLLICEGMTAKDGQLYGDRKEAIRYRLLVDPVDGTRNFMYDKRSAWFLAALAPDQGDSTNISDANVSVMVELPTSKQIWGDQFMAVRGQGISAQRVRLDTGTTVELPFGPSLERSLLHGFAHVANFFPGTKVLASDLMECIARSFLGGISPGRAEIYDDQYISTGGQMVELILGHDRFCCDIRPLFHEIKQRQYGGVTETPLECHPYDIAGMLVAVEAGVTLTDGFGRPLDAPFGVSHGVHWCGYANSSLRRQIEPIIAEWLKSHGVEPS